MKLSQLITYVERLRGKKNVLYVFCIVMFTYANEDLSH